MAHYSLASNGLLAGLRAAMCAAKPYFAEPCPQKYNDPPSWRAQVGCFKMFDRLISTSSNCGCLQTGPQSRQRATWHTIPLQAMVFWLACELLCVLSDTLWKRLLVLCPRGGNCPFVFPERNHHRFVFCISFKYHGAVWNGLFIRPYLSIYWLESNLNCIQSISNLHIIYILGWLISKHNDYICNVVKTMS